MAGSEPSMLPGLNPARSLRLSARGSLVAGLGARPPAGAEGAGDCVWLLWVPVAGTHMAPSRAPRGLEEPGLNRLIRTGYELLGLLTFFTVGPKEARAWTVTKGSKGPQAAGVIHTDFEHGYIRAETIAFNDYVAGKGEAGAREAGKFRLEGKEYVVQDGDVMHFRFNT